MARNEKNLSSELFNDELIDEEPDPKEYKIVSIRLREAEFVLFAMQTAALGLSHSMALRIAARRIGGFLEIDGETRLLLQDILSAIGQLSRNITELKRTCACTGTCDIAEFARLRAEFGREFARLDSRLSTILNVSRRRRDGRMILKDEIGS